MKTKSKKIKCVKCESCKKAPAMPVSLQQIRVQDIPDGEDITFGRLCEKCLEKCAQEIDEAMEG